MSNLTKLNNTQKELVIQQFGLHEATQTEIDYFFEIAKRTGADPLRRQIHATMRYSNQHKKKVMSIVFGIDWYRKQAANSGDYAGSDRPKFEGLTADGNPEVCIFTVYKIVQGHRVAFTDEARWSEYAQKYDGKYMGLWATKPHVMLSKCAESRVLRQGWPEQLAGTYIEEELHAQLIETEPQLLTPEQINIVGILAEIAGQPIEAWKSRAAKAPATSWDNILNSAITAASDQSGIASSELHAAILDGANTLSQFVAIEPPATNNGEDAAE